MKQDMIVILDLGSHENTVLARAIRALGVYSEIYPHDITVEELKKLTVQRSRRCCHRCKSVHLRGRNPCDSCRSRQSNLCSETATVHG